MIQITYAQYMRGRDTAYAQYFKPEYKANAEATIKVANQLLDAMQQDGVEIHINPETGSPVSSGWRPPQINATTPGAKSKSLHLTCEAIDIYDPEGDLDDWCMANISLLRRLGLSMEHPSATKGWCHVQIRPPKSGRVCFYP